MRSGTVARSLPYRCYLSVLAGFTAQTPTMPNGDVARMIAPEQAESAMRAIRVRCPPR